MELIGLILMGVSGALFFVKRHQAAKAFSIKSARLVLVSELKHLAGEIAAEIGGGSWRDYVKLYGEIVCDRPLLSELKQEPCVYYRMAVKRRYEEVVTRKTEDGKTERFTQQGTQTVASNQQSIPFILRDREGGEITVSPDGANIETVQLVSEFQPERMDGGVISYGRFSQAVSQVRSGTGTQTLGYEYSESALPVGRKVLVVGTVSDATGELTLQRPVKSDNQYIISLKTDEELAANADAGARNASYGMIGCAIAGVLLFLIGLIS